MLSRRLIALLAAPLMLPLMLGGCQTLESLGDHAAATVGLGDDAPRAYTGSAVSQAQRSGIVAADEPLAARAGASVLTSHGSAVDAVAAMFFTLTTTYPVAAGLGGGGICLVSEANGQVTEFDFLTKAPRRAGAYALPGAVKGFATMQQAVWRAALAARGGAGRSLCRNRLSDFPGAGRAAGFVPKYRAAGRRPGGGVSRRVRQPACGRHGSQECGAGRDAGPDTAERGGRFLPGRGGRSHCAYSGAQGGGVSPANWRRRPHCGTGAVARRRAIFSPGFRGRTGAGAFSASLFDNLSHSPQPRCSPRGGPTVFSKFRHCRCAGRFGIDGICRGGFQRTGGGLCRDLEWAVRFGPHRDRHRRRSGRDPFGTGRHCQRIPGAGDRHVERYGRTGRGRRGRSQRCGGGNRCGAASI